MSDADLKVRISQLPVETGVAGLDPTVRAVQSPVDVQYEHDSSSIKVRLVQDPTEYGLVPIPAKTQLSALPVEILVKLVTAVRSVFRVIVYDSQGCETEREYDIIKSIPGPQVQCVQLPVEVVYTNPQPSDGLHSTY